MRIFKNIEEEQQQQQLKLSEEAILQIHVDDSEVPSIEAVTSTGSSPSSSVGEEMYRSEYASASTAEYHEEEDIEEPKLSLSPLQINTTATAASTATATTASTSISDHYISKDDLLEQLLTPRFLQDYEDLASQQKEKILQERHLRKELIQKELDTLVQATEHMLALEEGSHEFEPEAVEALGVAANRVAYLRKYYDVVSCQYIYIPSVAHCIMNGSLLDEARHHYFGKVAVADANDCDSAGRDEFLIAYAAALGSTVMIAQREGQLVVSLEEEGGVDVHSLAEELDLSVESDDEVYDTTRTANSQVTNLVWGVPPTGAGYDSSRSSSSTTFVFDFETRKKNLQGRTTFSFPRTVSFVVVALLFAVTSYYVSLDAVQEVNGGVVSALLVQGRAYAETWMTEATKFGPSWGPETLEHNADATTTTNRKPVTLPKPAFSPSPLVEEEVYPLLIGPKSSSSAMAAKEDLTIQVVVKQPSRQPPVKNTDSTVEPLSFSDDGKRKVRRGAIVPNLLY
jgi:hypothetical protein